MILGPGRSLTVSGKISVANEARLGITLGGPSPTVIRAGEVEAAQGAIMSIVGYSGTGEQTVIRTENGIIGNFSVEGGGLGSSLERFMNVALERTNANRDLVIRQSLVWNQEVDAHGHFYVTTANYPIGFTMDAVLADNLHPGAGMRWGWNGRSLTKTGDGLMILGANNTYTGGTTVRTGTLQIGTGGTTGGVLGDLAIDANARVIFNRSDAVTFSGNISGTGSLIKDCFDENGIRDCTGTLTLTSANANFTGSMIVNAGTLAGNIGTYVNLAVAADAIYDGTGATRTINALSGEGSIFIGADGIDADGMIVRSGSFSGVISGDGSLIMAGPGILTLTGENTYRGGTTVFAGTLAGNTAGLQGRIINNASMVFDQDEAGTFNGTINTSDNTGNLFLNGRGLVSIAGDVRQANVNINSGGMHITAGHSLTVINDINLASGAQLSVSANHNAPTATARVINASSGSILNINGFAGEGQAVIQTTDGIRGDFILQVGGVTLPGPGLDRFMNV
jgi:autotransporter-associated beta strand protein